MSVTAGWGGARTPANPAVVSGPGANSARTDGGVMDPNSPAYGEGVELGNLQSQAPMAGSAGAAPGGGAAPAPRTPPVALGAPSRDQLPVTAGAAAGAGPGPEALGLPLDKTQESKADVRALDPAMVQALLAAASKPGATPSFKRRVREMTTYL